MVGRAVMLRLADSPRVERFVKSNGMASGFAKRFVAGERMEETVEAVRALNARRITVSLDYLGENVRREEEAAETVAYYRRLFRFIADQNLDANVSLKLTQLGLDLSDDLALQNMRLVLEEASYYNQFVRIDMEGSAYTARTLDLFHTLWSDSKNTGVVIQSYLYRSPEDVEKLVSEGVRVRLCKGAYNEPKEVAFQDKKDVDRQYIALMKTLVGRGNYPGIATHDPSMIAATREFVEQQKIDSSRYEFQMLYGIRRDLQESLVAQGYRMRVYMPFGTQWYGYLMRRLAERPANLWFVLKNVLRK